MWKTFKRGRLISLKEQVWTHKTSLTPPLFILPNLECKQKCIICYKYRFCFFLCFFFIWFWNCYDIFLFSRLFELFRHWGIFCFPVYFYNFSVELWKRSHSLVFLCLFFSLLLSYVSVLENLMWYNRSLGQRVDVGILGVLTVKSAIDCARKCHQHINCNNFNFRRINMKCELVGARKTDSKTNINYDVYSQC